MTGGPGQPGKNEGERVELVGRAPRDADLESSSSPALYAEVYRERYGVYPGVPLEHDDERLWVPWDEIGDVQ